MYSISTSKGTYKYNKKNIYLGIKRINKVLSKENLLDVKKLFDESGLFYGLAFGTVLGAVREHDFIEHDEDIDLYILEKDEQLFRDLLFDLRKLGFELLRYEKRGLYSIGRHGEYIDIYVMQDYTPEVVTTGGEYLLKKWIIETKRIKFQGADFRIPKDHEEYLEYNYGADWMTPRQYADFNLSKIQILKYNIISKIKSLIPLFLYKKLLHKHLQPERDKFNKRIKELGYSITI